MWFVDIFSIDVLLGIIGVNMTSFQELFNLDVSEHIDTRKQGKTELAYLSWAWAWAKVNEVDPDATYSIKTFTDELNVQRPYLHDPVLGYMVMTSVTMFGKTKEMWLPVMDGANKAMLDHPWEYKTKYEVKKVEPATMFDINKTLMRCLVKNIAMFGLGLKLYAGEDLPNTLESSDIRIETSLAEEDKKAIQEAPDFAKLKTVCRNLMNKLGEGYTKIIIDEYNKREAQLNANLQLSAEK